MISLLLQFYRNQSFFSSTVLLSLKTMKCQSIFPGTDNRNGIRIGRNKPVHHACTVELLTRWISGTSRGAISNLAGHADWVL